MEFTVKVVLTADTALLSALSAIVGKPGVTIAAPKTEDIKEEKAIKEVKKVAAKEKAAENGTIDLSTIRQHLAKSEANKQKARELLPKYEVEKLTDLDKKHYAEFYAALTAEEKDDL